MNIPIDRFEEWLWNKGLKERTVEDYIYYFNKFNYETFSQDTVSKFLSFKQHRNSVARSFLTNFQKFLSVNYKELKLNYTQRMDISEVELPKLTGRAKSRLIDPLSMEEITLLEKHLPEEKEKLQLLLSYYCGLRLGELLKISIISFNWNEWKKSPKEMGECRVYGKGDKEGIALVPGFLMKRLAHYIHSRKFASVNSKLFIRDSDKLNLKNASRNWQMKLRAAGISSNLTKLDEKEEVIKETSVHPHRLRHSYGDYLLNKKKLNLREVQELLRHSSISSTEIYTRVNKEELKQKLKEI